jgi:hypothetical protein
MKQPKKQGKTKMTHRHNVDAWLAEQDIPAAGGQPDPAGMQAPAVDPNQGMGAEAPDGDPNVANMDQQNQLGPPSDDVEQDPVAPDMPDDEPDMDDFEVWKNSYLKESIKGDTNQLMDMLSQVRDKEDLQPYQRKFVEDNWNIQLIRQNANVEQASNEIRKNIKGQLDKNNPATSVVNHISAVLETIPTLNNIYIKLNGYAGLKGDLHRKLIAALIGGVQVGSGGNNEDVIFNERDYSIQISTRFNARWGDVMLGNWSLKEDDPERYLKEPELKRLRSGSPEERDVLRRRIVSESIAELFETRAFIINVVGENGTIYTMGWDLAGSLRSAYTDGKLVVKTRASDNSEAMIDDNGNIVPLLDLSILFVKETGGQNEDGLPETEEIEFMERRDGMLFLTADMHTINEASTVLQGAVFKETPYMGNPSDLKTLVRCVYSAHDLLMRQC